MERSQKLFETIERHLANALTKEEQEEFNVQLHLDDDLQYEVELHRLLQSSLQDIDVLQFRAKVKEVGERIPTSSNLRRKLYRLSIAAAVLALIMGMLFFFEFSKNSLFDQYYRLYPVDETLRGIDFRSGAFLDYSAGDHLSAAIKFKELISAAPEEYEIRIYLANSLMELDRNTEAVEVLKIVPKHDLNYEHAQWYLALIFLKKNEIDAAVLRLDEVISTHGVHFEQAQTLRDKLSQK